MKKCKFCRNVFSSSNASQRVCVGCRPSWWDNATRRERSNFASRQTVPLRFQQKTCLFCRKVFVPEDKRAVCKSCRPSWFEDGTNAERDRYSSEKRLTPLRFQVRGCRECGSEFTPSHSAEVVCSKCRPVWWTEATEIERSNWITKGNIPFRFQEKRYCLFCKTLFRMKVYNEGFCGTVCRKRYSREYMKKWEAKLYESQPWRKMVARMRGRIHNALKSQSVKKTDSTMRLVGMSGMELMVYLLSHPANIDGRFTAANYGKEWSIDHIVPLAYFDLTSNSEQKKAFHFSNCQPLGIRENMAKGSSFNGVRHRHTQK